MPLQVETPSQERAYNVFQYFNTAHRKPIVEKEKVMSVSYS